MTLVRDARALLATRGWLPEELPVRCPRCRARCFYDSDERIGGLVAHCLMCGPLYGAHAPTQTDLDSLKSPFREGTRGPSRGGMAL